MFSGSIFDNNIGDDNDSESTNEHENESQSKENETSEIEYVTHTSRG